MPIITETTPGATGRESVVLDPSEVADGRVELDISRWVNQDGPDWGDAEIAAAVAERERGEVPVDYRIPNRKITIPLILLDRTSMTFTEFRAAIQQKVGLFQREGGWIKRDTVAGPLYADVANASLKLGGSALQSMQGVDADAVLTLEVLPDWYEDEITLTPDYGGDGDVIGLLLEDGDTAVIRGDSPARVRIDVNNNDASDYPALVWGFRSRYYDSAATAALALSGSATPVFTESWEITHVGSYRVWARISSVDSDHARLMWRVSDGPWTVNAAAEIPFVGGDTVVDLGTIRLDRAPVGTHVGSLKIDADDSTTMSISDVWLQPLDECAGELRDSGFLPAVLPASGQAQLRTEGMYRESSATAGVFRPISHVLGDLPRVPPSGLEQRPVEVFLSIFEAGADLSVQVHYRPSWLFAPGG